MTRIRGHPEFQREHEALEEILGQQWDLLGEDLADEGDELVVLVAQRRELRRTEKAKRRFLTEQQIGDTPHTPQENKNKNMNLTLRRSCDIRGRTMLTPYRTTSAADTGRLDAGVPWSWLRNTSSGRQTRQMSLMLRAETKATIHAQPRFKMEKDTGLHILYNSHSNVTQRHM